MMKNKLELTITEIDDMYQAMSAQELWQRGKDVEPLQIIHTSNEETDFEKSASIDKAYLPMVDTELLQLGEDVESVYKEDINVALDEINAINQEIKEPSQDDSSTDKNN